MANKQKSNSMNKFWGIIAYLPFICIFTFLFSKKESTLRFHSKQSLNMFLITLIGLVIIVFINIALSLVNIMLPLVLVLLPQYIFVFPYLIAIIYGIVNVCLNRAKSIPVYNKIKIIR